MSVDPSIRAAVALALALLFASAARHKLRDGRAFVATLAAYELLPAAWTSFFAAVVPAVELALAAWLASGLAASGALLAAAALLATYAAAIAINIARGRRGIDCGCAGPAAHVPLGPALVVRNLVLASAAVATALPVSSRTLGLLDLVTVAAAVAVLSTCWLASERLLALAPRAAALRSAMRHGAHA